MDANQEDQIGNAREHLQCAEILLEKFPLRAVEHLLSCVVDAAGAVSPQNGFVPLENLPGSLFVRTNPSQIVTLIAQLQGVSGGGNRNDKRLPVFAKTAYLVADGFLDDVEEHLAKEASPAPAIP